MHLLAPPITVFPPHERDRVESSDLRHRLATEQTREMVRDYIGLYVSEQRRDQWGPPDISMNTLVMVGQQLSVPGHYGQAPRVVGPNAAQLSAAMTTQWSVMQYVEYLAYCMGACAVRVAVVMDHGGYRAALEPVPPCHLWATPSKLDPGRIQTMRRLRVMTRQVGQETRELYVWEEWDLGADGAQPFYRLVEALADGELGDDVTAEFSMDATGQPLSALSGEAYPWRYASGEAYLPWVIHRSWDTGDLWNWMRGRGDAEGALRAMMVSSATTAVALNATGKTTIVIDAAPMSTRVETVGTSAVHTLDAEPGAMVFMRRTDQSMQPTIMEVGAVDTLPAVSGFLDRVVTRVMNAAGVTLPEASRAGANPMSGVAIALTHDQKRGEQRRAAPLRQRADVAMMHMLAAQLGLPDADVGVLYFEIPLTADETRTQLEVDARELETGVVSRVDVMMRRNPGITREQAIAEIVRIARDEAEIARLIAEGSTTPAPTAQTTGEST